MLHAVALWVDASVGHHADEAQALGAQQRPHGRDGRVSVGGVGYIEEHRFEQATGLDCVHICRLTHGDDGSVARRCKGLGNGPTDAAAAASDQHGVSSDVRANLGCHGSGTCGTPEAWYP